ncbi:MAG: hypothetical protein IJ767_03175 [Bacteroidaceae bacterium]|nr:hypothetical protein [Bacteroidaceae bacterium]MBR1800481.1 hypothetical protein [Bacteroidaceae bacterium]
MQLLGYNGNIKFKQTPQGLNITIPATKPNAIAPVFRITLQEDNRSAYE